ncbi:ser thr protein phosphatase family protein, putative [Ichthyophthirius multifiliis]|uniref:Serine/threonine-protein phosphatase n=1 Tax=Ichthyophthirius multifiliis TaxID=5932 RepID=G0R453_ICHMU|nr:ser thr protein phosphatase family protein, putative [Ichthyophthirius multifiliis]EGR27753.1 ser thr protein phosphatase family protein, putative [Ichthyophthirius multifiliis]|eukprot:XP_004025205.1 ser thr protein phosphatase family protein, putative [Ichthyophthirius multifiliis]
MDINQCLSNLKDHQIILDESTLLNISFILKEIFLQEPNIKSVNLPVNICGDIHGQFFDLLKLFNLSGQPPHQTYILIGDFVDRGYHSVETIQYLLCLKVKYPENVILVRGNHETRAVSKIYGFYDEIIRKYGNPYPWKIITDIFDYLPISALVQGKFFCVHGGLSPQIKTLDQLQVINRCTDVPLEGPFCDLLWSDPDENVETWGCSPRGAGWAYGWKSNEQQRMCWIVQ